MKKLQIVLLCILAACGYGVLHDQITARICLEYFTVAHPPLFSTSSVTLLALCWGVSATLGLGAVLGFVLAVVTQAGDSPPIPLPRVTRAVAILLAIMAMGAMTAGLLGYQLSRRGVIFLPASLARSIPVGLHDRFMAVWCAHLASYLVGLTGSAILCYRMWRTRGRPRVISVFPRSRPAALRAGALAAITAYVIWHRFAS